MVGRREQPKNYIRDSEEAKEGIINNARRGLRELRLGIESNFKEHPVLAVDEVATRLSIARMAFSGIDYKGERFSRMRRSAIERRNTDPALLSQKTIDDIASRVTDNGPCRIENVRVDEREQGQIGKQVTYDLVDSSNVRVATVEYYEKSGTEQVKIARGERHYPNADEASMTITLYSQVLEKKPPEFLHEETRRGAGPWVPRGASGQWSYRINQGEAIPTFGVETNGELTLLVSEENSANPIEGVTPEGATSKSDGLYVYYGETVFSGTRELAAIASRKDGSVITTAPVEEGR